MHLVRRIASSRGAICAGLLTGFAAMPAVAAADPVPIAGAGSGLSAPTGVARLPDGAIWVSDPIAGICRVSIEGSAR
jgi:streptogramin lyase